MINKSTKIVQLFLLFIIFIGAASCESQKDHINRPKHLIDMKKMVEVMKDVHLAEASLQTFKIQEKDSIGKLLYSHVFRIHSVREIDFYESLDYYSDQPEIMDVLYDDIIKELKEEEEKLKKAPKNNKAPQR